MDFIYTDGSVVDRRKSLLNASKSLSLIEPRRKMQILVDLSMIISNDSHTGIQRVVRAIMCSLMEAPPEGYDIRPIYASTNHGYRYVQGYNQAGHHVSKLCKTDQCVSVGKGDIFLGLDFAPSILPRHQPQLERWKTMGVAIHIVVYDLLPVLNPEWFKSISTRNYYRWLRTLAVVSDSAVCISRSVKYDLKKWFVSKYGLKMNAIPISLIPMGWDIQATNPSLGTPPDSHIMLSKFQQGKSALMVGTLEPRKGHAEILDAFEILWKNGTDEQLVIVGKIGWKVDKLVARITNHQQLGRNLFWLSSASDEYLEQIYQACFGLIMASKGEGFGLPLLEAQARGLPVLARKLAVFYEVKNSAITYFDSMPSERLALVISNWIACAKRPSQMRSDETWGNSTSALIKAIISEH